MGRDEPRSPFLTSVRRLAARNGPLPNDLGGDIDVDHVRQGSRDVVVADIRFFKLAAITIGKKRAKLRHHSKTTGTQCRDVGEGIGDTAVHYVALPVPMECAHSAGQVLES